MRFSSVHFAQGQRKSDCSAIARWPQFSHMYQPCIPSLGCIRLNSSPSTQYGHRSGGDSTPRIRRSRVASIIETTTTVLAFSVAILQASHGPRSLRRGPCSTVQRHTGTRIVNLSSSPSIQKVASVNSIFLPQREQIWTGACWQDWAARKPLIPCRIFSREGEVEFRNDVSATGSCRFEWFI
jgi:hypothetical protein